MELGSGDCQAGHYIPKGRGGSHFLGLPRYPADEWVEMNVNAQCAHCNLMEGGNFLNYENGLKAKYGEALTEKLKSLGANNHVNMIPKCDLIACIEHYRRENESLS